MKLLHLVIVTLLSTDDYYERASVFRSKQDADTAIKGAELLSIEASQREVDADEVLFDIFYSDGDRTEKAGLTLDEVKTQADDINYPELITWAEEATATISQGQEPKELDTANSGYMYFMASAYKAQTRIREEATVTT